MKFTSFTFSALITATVALGAAYPLSGALAAGKTQSTWQELKTKLFETFDKQTVTVNFKTGSSAVDESELSDLKALVAANKHEAKIDRVIVAAWADKDYPTEKGAKLSAAEVKLGDGRAARVKELLHKLGVANVDAYTMAEQPNWIQKAFNLSDAKIKGQGVAKDAEDNYVQEVGKKLRDKGGPGKAVVYVRHVGEFAAH